jgi:microcompartment protein CcmL/EutN
MKSLGFVEVSGVVAAVDALDIMCKSADVSLVSWERKLGGRLVTLIITGSVSAVQAAVDNAIAGCIKKPCSTAVIANPHPETVRLAELSAERLKKQEAAKEAAKAQAEEKKPEKAPAKPKSTGKKTTK